MLSRQWRSLITTLTVVSGACGGSTDPGGYGANRVGLTVDGFSRVYEWNAAVGAQSAPVIVVFHGAGGTAREMRLQTGMSQAGTREGYTVVFGEAADELNGTWSGGCSTCNPGDPRTIDDVRYLDAILTDLAGRTSIDRNRLYVAGFSAGGSLAYTLACRRSEIVRAIVAAGALLHRNRATQCFPVKPIGALVIFGNLDTTQPLNGSSTQFSVDSSAMFWSDLAQCSAGTGPTLRAFGTMTANVLERTGCSDNARVEAHTVMGFGHDWPVGGYDATEQALRLFAGR